jgi:D-glycero-alpha-D-manno-heptose 1-phosphate guanylyltransferase
MTVPTAVTMPLILAGGRGTRMAGLFPELPKPAIPVAGKAFLAWVLSQLAGVGFSKVVISGGHLFEVLKAKISPHVPAGMEVIWVQESKPLGTGGGAMHAARASGLQPQHWLVMNGDSYLGGDWPHLMASKKNGEACLVARQVADTGRYGRLEVTEGMLKSLQEKKSGGPGLINAGIYFLPRIWLNENVKEISQSMETELIPGWLSAGRTIRVEQVEAPFLDIGTPEDFQKAEPFFLCQKGMP